MDSQHALIQFLLFYRRAITRYRIHSPFVFQLAEQVLEDSREFYVFKEANRLRTLLSQNNQKIVVLDYGTGKDHLKTDRRISEIVKRSSLSEKEGKGLFRLVNFLKPKTMLELGTNLGLSTLYQAAASRNARFITLEGAPTLAVLAKRHLERYGLGQVEVQVGPFQESLKPALEQLGQVDYVYLDGDHREEAVIQNVDIIFPFLHKKSAVVIDDIYWSKGMTQAWKRLKKRPEVTLSIDLYDFGILFFDPGFREKQHLSLVKSQQKPWMK